MINTFWHGGPLSDMARRCLESHLAVGHAVNLWCYDPPPNVPEGVGTAPADWVLPEGEVFAYKVGPGAGSFSAFSNLFRYKLLLDRGGWWCDIDVFAVWPFAFRDDYVIASERTEGGGTHPASCVIKAPARSDLMRFCYERAAAVDRETVGWGEIGPRLLAEGVRKFGLGPVSPPDVFCPIDWFNFREFFEAGPVPACAAVHLWHEMWRRNQIDTDATYEADTLYERLKRYHLRPHPTHGGEQHRRRIGHL